MRRLVMVMMMAMGAVVVASAQAGAAGQTVAKPGTKDVPPVAGAWNMTVDSPHGVMVMKVELKVDGRKITGTLSNDMMGTRPLTGEVADGKLMFKLTADGAGEMEFNGKLKDADSLVGTLSSSVGDMACSATRAKVK